jgi:transposase-like protein
LGKIRTTITEELVGHSFSVSSIGQINKTLDAGLKAFCERRLKEPYPYLILDARYEKVREAGVITSQAVLIARLASTGTVDGRSSQSIWPTGRALQAGRNSCKP